MRKRESLYMHALLALVREEFEEAHDLSTSDSGAYDEMDVRPTAVHRPKETHRRAVFALSDELSARAASATDGSERTGVERGGAANQYAE